MGLFNLFGKNKKSSQVTNEEHPNLEEEIVSHAKSFVEQLKEKFDMDYSVSSLEILDSILESTMEYYQTETDETIKKRIIDRASSYVFEVGRQNFGGNYFWHDTFNQPLLITGQPEFEITLLAYDKVKGRLENGIEDNIPFFFAGYIRGIERKGNAIIV